MEKIWLVYKKVKGQDAFVCRAFKKESDAKKYEAWRDEVKDDDELYWCSFIYLDEDFPW